MRSLDDGLDDLDRFRQIVKTHLVDTLESSLRLNGISWTNVPATEGGYRVYRDAVSRLSDDVANFLSRRSVDSWIVVDIDGLVELYARGGIEPGRLYFGVGSEPTGDRLSTEEFESRFRALVEYHVEELGGSIAARLSTMYPRPEVEISKIEVLLGAEATTDVYVISEGEGGLLSGLLGLDEPEDY